MKYQKKPIIIEAYQTKEEKTIHTLKGDMKASIGDYIITGVNGEQYPCKPDIFTKTYDRVKKDHLTFGDALAAIKRGKRCARKGWNGKEQYIELARNISYVTPDNKVVNAMHRNIGDCAIAFVGTSGTQVGWLASQSDMLGEDWYILG